MKYLKILYIQVLIGMILGIITGWLFPSFAPVASLISNTFINMIRMVIAPVIFCSIVTGIAGAGSIKKVGRVGIKALIYFEIVSTAALVIGLIVANIVRPGVGVAHAGGQNNQVTEITHQAESFSWGNSFHILCPPIFLIRLHGEIFYKFYFSVYCLPSG